MSAADTNRSYMRPHIYATSTGARTLQAPRPSNPRRHVIPPTTESTLIFGSDCRIGAVLFVAGVSGRR